MGGRCWDHTLTPWPPPDGQLRLRPLSAGRRAVSVHEDQLQAPIGEGKHLHVCLSEGGDGGGWATGLPVWLWSLEGHTSGVRGGKIRGPEGQKQGSDKPFLHVQKNHVCQAREDAGAGEAHKASVCTHMHMLEVVGGGAQGQAARPQQPAPSLPVSLRSAPAAAALPCTEAQAKA